MKKLFYTLPIILLIAAACKAQPQPTTQQNQQARPTPSSQNPSPTATPTIANSNIQTYTGVDFTFQYPSDYKIDNPTQEIGYSGLKTIVSLTKSGTPTILTPDNSDLGAKIYISTDNKPFSVTRIPKDFGVNGPETPTKKTFGQNTWYELSGGGGGVNYADNFYYDLNGKLIQVEVWGPFTQNSQNHPDAESTEQLILSTFKSLK